MNPCMAKGERMKEVIFCTIDMTQVKKMYCFLSISQS